VTTLRAAKFKFLGCKLTYRTKENIDWKSNLFNYMCGTITEAARRKGRPGSELKLHKRVKMINIRKWKRNVGCETRI
jgi:hypothetical protein